MKRALITGVTGQDGAYVKGGVNVWSVALPRKRWGYKRHRRIHLMELHTLGIDLGKAVFHAVGLNGRGDVVFRKKFSRIQLLRFIANLKVDLIGMESCGGAHFLGRALRD